MTTRVWQRENLDNFQCKVIVLKMLYKIWTWKVYSSFKRVSLIVQNHFNIIYQTEPMSHKEKIITKHMITFYSYLWTLENK